VPARNGYNVALRSLHGWILSKHTEQERMGWNIVFTGKSLNYIENSVLINLHTIMKGYKVYNPNIPRIDFAIDVFNSGVKPEHYATLHAKGKCSNKRSKGLFIKSTNDIGSTFYLGSLKKRKKLLRIYDKGAEQGVNKDWLRIELQLSNGLGTPYYNEYIDNNWQLFDFAKSAIKGYCDFPNDELWNYIFTSNELIINDERKVGDGREKWLLDTVAGSLAEHCIENEGFRAKFFKRFQFELSKEEETYGNLDVLI